MKRLFSVLAIFLAAVTLQANTIHVPGDYSTITLAMQNAQYGDTVLVAPGTYQESIVMQEGVILLSEAGPTETIIALNGIPFLITGANDAVIKGFTVADNYNGPAQAGIGIYSDGDNVTICYCIIISNNGGIYLNNNSQAIIFNNTIDNNYVDGIFMQIEPAPVIYNNIITNNGRSGIHRNTAHSLGNPFIQYNDYYGNPQNYGYFGDPWTPEPGIGELFENPLFEGGSPFDYHLTENSTCIDAGDPNSPLDPDKTIADMGALYFDQSTGGAVVASVLCSDAVQGCSTTICIEVDMSDMNPPDDLLGSFAATLIYDPSCLVYTGNSGFYSGFTGNVVVDEVTGLITINGANPIGMGGVVLLLCIDFDVIGPVGAICYLNLEFSAMAAALTFTDFLPLLTVNDCSFTILAPCLLGDINGDGLCNSTDCLITLSYDVGLPIPPEFLDRINAGCGDANSDGLTNSTDCLILLSFDVGIPVPFPVCEPFCPPTAAAVYEELNTKNIGN